MFSFGCIYIASFKRAMTTGGFTIKVKFKNNITQRELQEELSYNPDTGDFFWIKPKSGRCLTKPAGTKNPKGYITINLGGVYWLAHRLAFVYMQDEFPPEYVDHIDGNPSNNSWNNLRPCSAQENSRNKKRKYDSFTGIKGVTFNPVNNTWEVQIKVGELYKRFGPFFSYQKACQVYDEQASKAFGDFYKKEPIRKQKASFKDEDVTKAIEEFMECQNSQS